MPFNNPYFKEKEEEEVEERKRRVRWETFLLLLYEGHMVACDHMGLSAHALKQWD